MTWQHCMDCPQHIVLVHGIWNTSQWTWALAHRLRHVGFGVDVFGYGSVLVPFAQNMHSLRKKIARPCMIVGHSLGGVLAVQTLLDKPMPDVVRVVCLGSPLQGSVVAQRLGQQPWSNFVLGHSALALQHPLHATNEHIQALKHHTQIGMVAGSYPRGVGRFVTHMTGPSDGTVGVCETQWPHLDDHCVVSCSHTGLLVNADAAQQTVSFLRRGHFGHGHL